MNAILTDDFKPACYWWEEASPWTSEAGLPQKTQVLIIGSGYAGLSAALELSALGVETVVVDANEVGWGASSRNGGGVGGALSVGKSFTGKQTLPDEDIRILRRDATQAFPLVRALIERENIDCDFTINGRFVGAYTQTHFRLMEKRAEELNRSSGTVSYRVEKDNQREHIASDYYYGGMVTEGSATLQPAKYVRGLLNSCLRQAVQVISGNPVVGLTPENGGWRVSTRRGDCLAKDVIVATNGYTSGITPEFQRRIIPVSSHMIATEELPAEVVASIFPSGRMISDSKRILYYYRPSPDGRRIVFGGRARFTNVGEEKIAALLHKALLERLPQLDGVRISHAWTGSLGFTFDATAHMGALDGLHYCMGCNGSGIAMMTYLGYQTARKVARVNGYACAFDRPSFPGHPLYGGNTWFLPFVGGWYRMRDNIDRAFGGRS
jgi:glycine/D-amino acid oxidase-like deaminating enzyme